MFDTFFAWLAATTGVDFSSVQGGVNSIFSHVSPWLLMTGLGVVILLNQSKKSAVITKWTDFGCLVFLLSMVFGWFFVGTVGLAGKLSFGPQWIWTMLLFTTAPIWGHVRAWLPTLPAKGAPAAKAKETAHH